MKKVIYINCFLDPWVKVAEKMMTERGFEPVYWVGYKEEQGTKEIIAKSFPNAMFQYDIDAWRGIFPAEVKEKAASSYIDIDFLRKFSAEELQALKMMERLDPDRYSFNLMERQSFFQNLVKSWTACLDITKPDMVITPATPHRVFDYVLFLLCCYRNIPFLSFDHMPFNGRFIIQKNNIYSIGELFKSDYLNFEKLPTETLDVPNDILQRFKEVNSDYDTAKPYYMSSEEINNKRWTGALRIAKHIVSDAVKHRKELFGEHGRLKYWGGSCYKQGKYIPLENGHYSAWLFYKNYLINNRYKKSLLKYYESLTTTPDYSAPYIVYFLHYQPEATSSPIGNIFVDQRLCIETLLKNLPENYMVYVKEHPHQLMTHREGHMSRMKDMYSDLIANKRVKLISLNESSFDLIKHSKAIGTICGTVGWESIVRQKPVVLFGFCWYENYNKGVIRITDDSSAKNIQKFIETYQYDEHSLMAYLAAVGKNTKYAYYYKAYHKEKLNMTEQECITTIIDSIIEKYNS